MEKQIKVRSDLTFASLGGLSDELDSFGGIQRNNAHNEQKIAAEFESLKNLVESEDLEALEARRTECRKLGERINAILAARTESVQFLSELKDQMTPIAQDIEEMQKKAKSSDINAKETLDRCNMLGVELVDCLKLATQVDSKAQTGQLHFSHGQHTSGTSGIFSRGMGMLFSECIFTLGATWGPQANFRAENGDLVFSHLLKYFGRLLFKSKISIPNHDPKYNYQKLPQILA